MYSSPFGGIPRNWKQDNLDPRSGIAQSVPPSGGSLEIGNWSQYANGTLRSEVPPSGGSLEIGNDSSHSSCCWVNPVNVPPSGGSLEIGNELSPVPNPVKKIKSSPFGGIPRNWKRKVFTKPPKTLASSPFGGIPRNWKLDLFGQSMRTTTLVPPSGGSLEIGNRI